MTVSNKIFLFNLCENPTISSRTILRLYNGLVNLTVEDKDILEYLGDTNTSQNIISAFQQITEDSLSIFSLLSYDICIPVIENLRTNFSDISDLANHVDELDKLNFQIRTIDKIKNFINRDEIKVFLKKNKSKDEAELIITELEEIESAISTTELYSKLVKKNGYIDLTSFTQIINKLALSNRIKYTGNGISLKKETLTNYITQHYEDRNIEILDHYLNKNTLEETAKKYGITRQRVDQILDKKISRMPIFENEMNVHTQMSEYKFSDETLSELFVSEPKLPYYVKTKYKLAPSKTELDYVIENNLSDKSDGLRILKRNNYGFIRDELYRINFNSLFSKFLNDNEIVYFEGQSLIGEFRNYLYRYNINLETEVLKGISIDTKMRNAPFLLNYGNNRYYYFLEERYDELFLTKARDYLENFYGFGYVDQFFYANEQLCLKNQIYDSSQLFIVLKELFGIEFSDSIEFVRNPSIETKGINRNDFLVELIEQLQPIKYDDFVSKFESDYGINKANFSVYYSGFLQKYKMADGYLSTDIKNVNEDDPIIKTIHSILNNQEIITRSCFTNELLKIVKKDEINSYLSKYFIQRMGYKITKYALYKLNYPSVFDAIKQICTKMDVAIDEYTLKRIYPIEQIDSKYDLIKQNCLLLRFSDSKFINTQKVAPLDMVIEFRDKMIQSLNIDEIYTIQSLNETVKYKQLLSNYKHIAGLIQSFNNEFLVSIIQSSTEITYLDGNIFVFGKGKRVTQKRIICHVIEEESCIDRYDLLEILDSQYGIELDNPTASYFAELGFFFSDINNKVYKNKALYNDELKDYLNTTEVK